MTSKLRSPFFDALVVVLAVVAEVKVWLDPGEGSRAFFIVGSLLWTLPLLLRHRAPFAAPVFAFAVQAGAAFADPTLGAETTMSIAFLLAFWVVGACNDGSRALAGAAIGVASLAVVALQDVRIGLEEAISGTVMGGVICLIGYALQRRTTLGRTLEERAARLELEREERTRAAVAEERKRIARELHDVVAHSVSVMTIQAGAARLVLDDDPARALPPLRAIEDTGRHALVEMSRLLGILGGDGSEPSPAPQPTLSDLDPLLAQARAAGLPVELTVEGEPAALPPGLDLAAYRIVQEALTNARKHAGPSRAQVRLCYKLEAIELEVADDGDGSALGDGGGHGLVGMRERAALYDGKLEAGPRPGGGFTVRARLPLEAVRS